MFNVIRGLPRGGKVMSSIFEQIKFKVTARQVAESYGIKVSRNGMACCPFHNDKHPSMKIDQNYYCFACGAKGDAINFVASMFGLTQFEAAKKINEDFSLRIPIGKSSERKGQSKRKNDCNKTQTKEERIRFVRRKIAESGKRMRTKKEILDENGKIRKGCRVVNKGEIYEINFFYPKEEIFKSNQFLRDIKQIMTDAINGLVKDENEKLYVFQKGGPYLATKKIGKNNPRADEIRTDNYLRQKWNENVDRAFLVGATEEEISLHKKEQIDKPVAESIKMQGENPQAFTGILQKAIGMLRGFAEYLRAMELVAIDESGRSLIGREIKIDVTPEDLTEKQKISRPSSIKQETEVMRVKQILNDLKKQEKKVYAIEKNVIRLEKELREVQKKWFHGKEKKELQNRVDGKRNQLENAQYMMNLILSQNGYRNVLEVVNDLKQAEKELQKVQEEQREWDEQKSGSKKLYLSIPVAKQKEESRERKISDEKALPEQPKKRKRRDMEL